MDLQYALDDRRLMIDVGGDPMPHDVGMGYSEENGDLKILQFPISWLLSLLINLNTEQIKIT